MTSSLGLKRDDANEARLLALIAVNQKAYEKALMNGDLKQFNFVPGEAIIFGISEEANDDKEPKVKARFAPPHTDIVKSMIAVNPLTL